MLEGIALFALMLAALHNLWDVFERRKQMRELHNNTHKALRDFANVIDMQNKIVINALSLNHQQNRRQ